VGFSTSDDAAIYQLSDELALVQTVDFFPPVVDDPFSFGAIAAANAVSDIYAMGARPLLALNIVCFPKTLPLSVLAEILNGGASKAEEAGFVIVGGHTIEDKEPKYGLAITGLVDPKKIVTNATAQEGDELILTKPLGTGIITTGIKADCVTAETIERVVAVMTALNKRASEAMVRVGVSACTDITGFGLLGHLWEMARASKVGARIKLSQVPVIEETWGLVAQGMVPGGTHRNQHYLRDIVTWSPQVSEDARLVLCDAQTSGGLLIAVPAHKSSELLALLGKEAWRIGEMVRDGEGRIEVIP